MLSQSNVNSLKAMYPSGTRIMLASMGDDPNPIPDNTKGTVQFVDDAGTLHTNFDNGRFLGVCPEADRFYKLNEQTEAPAETEEQEPTLSM